MTFTKEEQDKFLALISKLDLDLPAIGDETQRKWYSFGAYDALRILTEKVLTEE